MRALAVGVLETHQWQFVRLDYFVLNVPLVCHYGRRKPFVSWNLERDV